MQKSTRLLRFADLQDRGIVHNRQQLANLVRDHGFPAGWMLTANARVFDEDDVEAWLDTRRQSRSQTPEGHQAVAA
jgi:predicted DNA-binding transcriptional regulator AlpA